VTNAHRAEFREIDYAKNGRQSLRYRPAGVQEAIAVRCPSWGQTRKSEPQPRRLLYPINDLISPACQVRKVPTGDSRSRFSPFSGGWRRGPNRSILHTKASHLAYKGKSLSLSKSCP